MQADIEPVRPLWQPEQPRVFQHDQLRTDTKVAGQLRQFGQPAALRPADTANVTEATRQLLA